MPAINAQLDPKAVGSKRRAAPRRKLHLPAEGITTSGTSNVLILDMSTTGVLLRTAADLSQGETIELNIPEAVGARAVVRWSSGQVFGCKFREPISKAALSAALLRAPPSGPPVSRDAFASQNIPPLADDAGLAWVIGLALLSWGVVIAAAAPLLWL
jgi:hypothetical protein